MYILDEKFSTATKVNLRGRGSKYIEVFENPTKTERAESDIRVVFDRMSRTLYSISTSGEESGLIHDEIGGLLQDEGLIDDDISGWELDDELVEMYLFLIFTTDSKRELKPAESYFREPFWTIQMQEEIIKEEIRENNPALSFIVEDMF